jgi:hypothetical protein
MCGDRGDSNSDYELICCDRCGRGYHMECIYPDLDIVTLESLATQDEWFCSVCS